MFHNVAKVSVLWLMLSSGSVYAQNKPEDKKKVDDMKSLWNPQQMMQQACDGISTHYNLNQQQREFTCKLLTDRTLQFLGKHDKDIWPLLFELTELQYSGKQPDAETAKRISSRGYNIFKEAQDEILRAQEEFHQVLNDEQKKIHDKDVQGLRRQFETIDKRFKDWQEGKVEGRPPLGNIRLAGGNKLVPEPASSTNKSKYLHEDKWEKYVNDFIQNYQLDDAQKTSALSILSNLKNQATQYRQSHQKELADAEKDLRDAQSIRPLDPKAIEQAKMIRDMLNKPFEDWFNELKNRLDQLPTEKQKEEYRKKFPVIKSQAGVPRKGSPTSQPTSQPVAVPRNADSGDKKPDASSDNTVPRTQDE